MTSPRHRPEVDEADRLDALGLHLVERRGCARLGRQLAVDRVRGASPSARLLASSWRCSSSSKSSMSCWDPRTCSAALRARASAAPRGSSRMAVASCSRPLGQSDREPPRRAPRPAARAAAAAPRRRAPRPRGACAWMTGSTSAAARRQQGALEQVERLRLRLAAVGLERALALARLDPAGRDRDQLLVQPRRPWAVEGEPAEQDDARDRVVGLGQAGAREVVVDEALGGEAAEQALDDALLQMQVDDVLVHRARVLEDDRPDRRRRGATPRASGRACAAPGACPACRPRSGRPLPLVEGGKLDTAAARPSSAVERLQRLGAHAAPARRRSPRGNGPRRGRCHFCESSSRVRQPVDLRLAGPPGARAPPPAPPRRSARLLGVRGRPLRCSLRERGRCRGGGCPA